MALRPLTPELCARWTADGWWSDAPLHALVDATADEAPDRLAVADQHHRWTYAELVARSSALARWLLAEGLEPGDVVALQTANRVAIPLVHLACDRAGLVFLPLPDAWRRAELHNALTRSWAAVLLVPRSGPDVCRRQW